MGKGNAMPNDTAIAREPIWRIVQTPASLSREDGELSRVIKFFIWIGTLMADTDSPKGWKINPTVIGLVCTVITLLIIIAGGIFTAGWYFGSQRTEINALKDKGAAADYARGKQDAINDQLRQQLAEQKVEIDRAKKEAADAKTIAATK